MQPTLNLVSLEPAQTLRFWNGLPQDFSAINAAYERVNDSQIVFFIGEWSTLGKGGGIPLLDNATLKLPSHFGSF